MFNMLRVQQAQQMHKRCRCNVPLGPPPWLRHVQQLQHHSAQLCWRFVRAAVTSHRRWQQQLKTRAACIQQCRTGGLQTAMPLCPVLLSRHVADPFPPQNGCVTIQRPLLLLLRPQQSLATPNKSLRTHSPLTLLLLLLILPLHQVLNGLQEVGNTEALGVAWGAAYEGAGGHTGT